MQKQNQTAASPSSKKKQQKIETDNTNNITILLNKNSEKNPQIKITLDKRIINFGIPPLQSQDYSQVYQLPQDIANNEMPFDIVTRFAQAHHYTPKLIKIKLPINSSSYRDVVDPVTYQICQRYTNLQYAAEIDEILRLAKWMQFKELQQAVAAAVAVNFYTGYEQKQVQEFMKKNQLDDITPQQIQQIIQENKDIFNYVQQKTKQQFLRQIQQNNTKQ